VLAAVATRAEPERPLEALMVGEHPDPQPPDGWVLVRVRAAALNHHDLWTLRGVGVQRLPIVLGCDAAGITEDGEEVVVHAVIGDPNIAGDETLDPDRSLLSERYDGTLAEWVAVPRRNLVRKPPSLSFEEAACLPTAWLTAYRMLFVKAGLRPGQSVLVQGAGGGVSTAAVMLAAAAGIRVYVTSRDPAKRSRALELGANAALEPGARLPERVHAVLETVGAATWDHSLKAVADGGCVVVAGATTGAEPPADLRRIFFRQIRVLGSTMGTKQELVDLARTCETTGIRPLVDRVLPLAEARQALELLERGETFGKLVLVP
jgi:NADPH:quinone reductase-like Zn-dependent oxidoreductase